VKAGNCVKAMVYQHTLYQASTPYFDQFPEDFELVTFPHGKFELVQNMVSAEYIIELVETLNSTLVECGYTSVRTKFYVLGALLDLLFFGLFMSVVEFEGFIWPLSFMFLLVGVVNFAISLALKESRKRTHGELSTMHEI
jgi:hypothetical protein